MVPKSNDGDTSVGETSDLELIESMEASNLYYSSTSRKRKTDNTSPVSGSSEEEEKKEEDSCESDQAWGFDSFDDTDYESDQDDDDEDFEWNRYLCHVYNSRGFNVDSEIIPDRDFEGLRPFNFDGSFLPNISGREYMDNMAKMALEKYNQHNGTEVMFDHVVVKMSAGVKSYITFMAKESPKGDLIEYQAKTQWKVWQRNAHAILCRPVPAMKPIPEKYLV